MTTQRHSTQINLLSLEEQGYTAIKLLLLASFKELQRQHHFPRKNIFAGSCDYTELHSIPRLNNKAAFLLFCTLIFQRTTK